MTKKYTVDTSLSCELTDEDITDLVITALEGGIGYWACLDNTGKEYETAPKNEAVSETVARLLLNGSRVKFVDAEDILSKARWTMSIGNLLNGISLYVSNGYDQYNVFSGGAPDMGMIDSEAADTIFQLALFGEVVYG